MATWYTATITEARYGYFVTFSGHNKHDGQKFDGSWYIEGAAWRPSRRGIERAAKRALRRLDADVQRTSRQSNYSLADLERGGE